MEVDLCDDACTRSAGSRVELRRSPVPHEHTNQWEAGNGGPPATSRSTPRVVLGRDDVAGRARSHPLARDSRSSQLITSYH
jgi:hypothetical protein